MIVHPTDIMRSGGGFRIPQTGAILMKKEMLDDKATVDASESCRQDGD